MSFKGFEYIFHEKMYVIEVIAENRVGILWKHFSWLTNCARCNFDLQNFESFRSKRPIELINVRVSDILRIWNDIPKRPNSFYWAKRKTTICVRNGLMLLWNFFACFIFVPFVDLLDVWQT